MGGKEKKKRRRRKEISFFRHQLFLIFYFFIRKQSLNRLPFMETINNEKDLLGVSDYWKQKLDDDHLKRQW